MDESTEKMRERLLALIEADFESDAAFERAAELPPKTVNNWRRDASASFMKLLPRLAEALGMSLGELYGLPPSDEASPRLSDDEAELLRAYREARTLPQAERQRLLKTLVAVTELCVSAAKPARMRARSSSAKKTEK